jgi:Ca2+-binding RTX toxin-like protein
VPGSDDRVIDSGGVDVLDFSKAARGVTVDLNLGGGQRQVVDSAGNGLFLFGTIEGAIGSQFDDQFTGNSADNYLAGLGGADKLVGQDGNDILDGGAGDDNIVGGAGRDVIISGAGADRTVASSEEDILIAGFTAYDGNQAALNAVRDEWASSRDYDTRVANIRGTGTGPRLNGDVFFTTTGASPTVRADGQADTLTGSQSRDWFFVGPGDTITDQVQNEFVDHEA